MEYVLSMKVRGTCLLVRGPNMSHRKDDKLKNSENLLNHIPYNKLINFSKKGYVEAFLVYVSSKHSLLPEIAEVMPPEQLFNFLFAFSGQTIHVPDQKVILDAFRDLDIFDSLTSSPTFAEVQRLSTKYQTSTQTVKSVAERVGKALNKPCSI